MMSEKQATASVAGKPGKKRPLWRRIRLVLLLFLVTFVLCEVGIRVFFAFMVGPRTLAYGTPVFRDARGIPSVLMRKVGYTPPTPDNPVGAYMKFAPHEIKIDRDENGERFNPTINRRGFRGPDFDDTKPPGVVRVVTLGASSTFGYHDRDDETYPRYLESFLNEAEANHRFEVINLGIPHITSAQIVSLFLEEALPLDPDVVTFYAGFNDSGIGINAVIERRSGAEKQGALSLLAAGVFRAAAGRLLLLSFADSLLTYSGARLYIEEDLRHQAEGKSQQFLANIGRIRAACEEQGILFVVTTQQARSRLIEREDIRGTSYADEADLVRRELLREGVPRRALVFLVHEGLMRDLRTWARAGDTPLVDAIHLLDDERDVLLTYVHLSPRGNQTLARGLRDEILALLTPAREYSSAGTRPNR